MAARTTSRVSTRWRRRPRPRPRSKRLSWDNGAFATGYSGLFRRRRHPGQRLDFGPCRLPKFENPGNPRFSQTFGGDEVAHALLRAASALMPTLGPGRVSVCYQSVETSLQVRSFSADRAARAKSFISAVPLPRGALTLFRGYPRNPHIVFVEKFRQLLYFEFWMNSKTVCQTCKNKGCVARCRFQRPEPIKNHTPAIKEVTK